MPSVQLKEGAVRSSVYDESEQQELNTPHAHTHTQSFQLTRLDKLGQVLKLLARTTIDLLLDLVELAGNVGSVAIQHGCVAVRDLTRVVQDDDLSQERLGALGGVVLGVTSDVATTDILDGHVLDVEADVVSGNSLLQLLVVHLNGLDLSSHVDGGKGDDHARLQDTSLNTTDGDCADTANLVHVLKGQTERLGGGALRGDNGVQSLEQGLALGLTTLLAVDLPTLVPRELHGSSGEQKKKMMRKVIGRD